MLQVAAARGLPRLLARLGKNREQDRRQDRDNGNHHEQLDQREGGSTFGLAAIGPEPSLADLDQRHGHPLVRQPSADQGIVR
jgi:hypothetical protein